MLIFVMPWENTVTLPGLGTASRGVGVLLAMAWFIAFLVQGTIRKPRAIHIAIYLFFLFNAASFFWTVDSGETLDRIRTYVQLLVLVVVLWDMLRDKVAFLGAMQAYVAGSYISISSLILAFRTMSGSETRFGASGFNVNDIGLIISLGIPMAWYLALFGNRAADDAPPSLVNTLFRMANFAYPAVAVLAIFLTGSRGSLISTAPSALFMLATVASMGTKARAAVVLGCASAVVAIPFIVPDELLDRIATTGESIASGDFGGRGKIWSNGVNAFYENPLIGTGAGTCSDVIGRSAHNVYLSVIVDVGMTGFVLLLLIIVAAIYEAVRQPSWSGRLSLALLMILALGSMVHTWEQRKQTWLVLSLVVVSADVSTRRSNGSSISGILGTGPSRASAPLPLHSAASESTSSTPYPSPRFRNAWRT